MIVTSQPAPAAPNTLAARAASAATLGIGEAIRGAIPDAEAARREQLEDMSLSEPLRKLLDEAFQAAGGAVAHRPVDSEIGPRLQLQYTVARTPALEVVLLQIPASLLADGSQIRRLLMLTYVLRGKTVRVFSPDLKGEPSSAFNGLKRTWEEDHIQIDFVPLSHVEELEQGKADLENVLKLELHPTSPAAKPSPGPATPAGAVRTVRVFLASSSELRQDRDEFELYFRQQNDKLRRGGVYLEINRWENFLDAMSATRLQDEYNKAVADCDIFVSLFFTKVGKFTEEEFDTAHRQFKTTGKPHIYTFFKSAQVSMGEINDEVLTLLNFRKKLSSLGHYYTDYKEIEHLKRQFRDQLDTLLKEED